MLMEMDLQFFSHHKGGGSTANGRNSINHASDTINYGNLVFW